jgi:DNA mismatch repair protein MutS
MSLSNLPIENNYVCPVMDISTDLEIKNGRDPVIEKQIPIDQTYIANDLVLNRNQQQIIMIT